MFFGTRTCFKSVLASKLAALLAWSSVHHGDRVGGLLFSETHHLEFRPKRGKAAALHLIQQLASHPAWIAKPEQGDDIVKVKQSTLIGLHRDARNIPLITSNVKAQMSGGHLSAFRGRGMEYHESRPYQSGDDIRAIDWRVTARSGRTHTKMYRVPPDAPQSG